MKNCPNCNGENRDEALFCTKCGNKLEEQPSNTDINTIQNDNTSENSDPGVNQVIEPTVQPSANETPPVDPPKKKSKVMVYVIGIVAVIAIIFLAMNISFAKPVNKLIKGLVKLSKMNKYTTTTTIDIAYDGDDDEADFISDFALKLETAADVNDVLAQVTLDLLYSNKSVIEVAAGINNEDVYIDLKDLHKKVFYQEIEDVFPDYPDYINDYKIIKKAFDDISLKFDTKNYIKIIDEVLDDNIKGSGNKVTVTLDSKTMSKLVKELLEEAEDDKKLRESIRKNGIDFINRIIKEKRKLEIIDVDDLEEILEIFEDKGDFEDFYQEAIANALIDMDYMDFDIDDINELELTFRFGAGNTIKGIDFTGEIDDELEINVKNDIKSGASFTKFNKKNSIEINELISGGDIEDVAEEISENLIKAIKKNKDLKNKIEDLTGEDIDDLIEMFMYGVLSPVW
ncbi:MAG TPA: hypothetical protein GXZ22_09775 [Clostridiaceae bacterium]|nr:hypothetical protein [Clostridiaceae bacterium]